MRVYSPVQISTIDEVTTVKNSENLEVVNRLDDLTNHSHSAAMTGNDILVASVRGAGAFRIQVRGSWTGLIRFEQSVDGSDWVSAGVVPFSQTDPTGTAAVAASTTVNGNWVGNAAAFIAVRVRCDSVVGSANVWIEVNHAVTVVGAFQIADGLVDANNSTNILLGANEQWEGTKLDMLPFSTISVNIIADQPSADNNTEVLFSIDGVSWDFLAPFKAFANEPLHLVYDRRARYFKVRYKNGPTPQTKFHIQVIAQRAMPSIPKHTLGSRLETFRTTELVSSVLVGRKYTDNNYVELLTSPEGILAVGVTNPFATEATAAAIKAKTNNLDVALSTLLKPADTLAKVATVDTITNPVTVVQPTFANHRSQVEIVSPTIQIWNHVEPASAQAGAAIWTPASGKKIYITSLDVGTDGSNIQLVTLWFGAVGDTTFTLGTDQVLFRQTFAKGLVAPPSGMAYVVPRIGPLNYILRLTTSANVQTYVTVYGFEQ